MQFSKRKFISLTSVQQHRKCAELLRIFYEKWPAAEEEIFYYHELLAWMKLPIFFIENSKMLADRYHWHLQASHLCLKEHNLLPSIRKGDHIPKCGFPNISIYLDNIRSAYNVGSILRTSEALRIGSVYFAEKTPFIDNEKVQRTAMGAAEIVPCHQHFSLSELPRPLIALDTSDEAIPVASFLFPEQFTLVLGNEEYGVSDSLLTQADILLEIPLFGAKNSLNVACAFAITAAEIRRQRQ
jgi:tRNA G18 (ribose-2'-O)-methylase SpoU